jgi:hypothetical protein
MHLLVERGVREHLSTTGLIVAGNKSLTLSEIQDLISAERPGIDAQLSELTQLDAYQFSDGRILFLFDGEPTTGTLWDSRDDVLQSLGSCVEPSRRHILQDRLPQGQTFAARIPELLANLADLLELDDSDLDFSQRSLDRIDRLVKDRFQPEDRLGSQLFPCLVAYLGELVRQRVAGSWEMRFVGEANVWEPWVHSPDGRQFAPFVCVHEQLTNHTDASAQLVRSIPTWARAFN